MITLPCLAPDCDGHAELPPEDSETPLCRVCKRPRPVRWFHGKGKPGTKSYLSAFDVWRLHMISSGRVQAGAR